MSNFYIRPGFWNRTKDKVKGALDLRSFVRNTLKDMFVPTADPCCPDTTVGAPVRFKDGKLEYYDSDTEAWVQVNVADLEA